MVPEDGDTVSFVIELESGKRILVDSGVDTVRNLRRANIDPCSITDMVITHSHGDHIAGLPMYLFYRYKYAAIVKKVIPSELRIITTRDAWEAVKAYIDIPYPALSDDPRLIVEKYVEDGSQIELEENYLLHFFFSNHNPTTFGFKLSEVSTGKSVVYSADSAVCTTVFDMAENTDCLIHDVVADSMFPMFSKAGHSLCKEVGERASQKKVKMLVPVHRLPLYKEIPENYEKEIRDVYSGHLYIPSDGDVIKI